MKTNAVSIIAILLIASLAMVSCAQPNSNPANAKDLVQVSFTKPEAKSASVTPGTVDTPELGSLWFQYKAVKNAADDSGVTIGAKSEWTDLGSSAGLAQTIELSRGKWDISLRGFASSANRASGTNPIFEGNVTYDVGADLATRGETVNVELDFTNPSGTGSYQIAVTVPQSYVDESAKVKVTVTPSSGTEQSEIKTYSSEATQTFTFSGLANGSAQVKVEYMDNTGASIGDPASANMLIMTDMTTKGVASVSETNTYSITFAGAINGTAEGTAVEKIELSGDAFVVIDQGVVADFKLPVSGYSGQQVKLYVADSPNYNQSEVISNGICATVALDSEGEGYGEVVTSETKAVNLKPEVIIGETGYTSIANAIAAASEGDILRLLVDVDLVGQEPFEYNKSFNITFDMQNYSLSNISDGMEFVVTGTGSITVKNKGASSLAPIREYKKVAIVVTSLDGSAKSDVVYATLCETSME